MYQKEIMFGMDLYSICIVVGVILAMVLVRVQADLRGMRARLQNLCLFGAVAAVSLGYGSAVLFQAFYNFMAGSDFAITGSTGATFYGGLIGGTALFIALYFIAGKFLFTDSYHALQFRTVSDMAPAAIAAGHGLGRIGCLMAGCCHGARSDAWYAIPMNIPHDGTTDMVKVVPAQLFEALFLLALAAFLFFSFWKKWRYQMPIYMIAYSLWRFVAEYLRDDYRGETVIKALTPSELVSVLLLVGGIALLAVELWLDHRKGGREA